MLTNAQASKIRALRVRCNMSANRVEELTRSLERAQRLYKLNHDELTRYTTSIGVSNDVDLTMEVK